MKVGYARISTVDQDLQLQLKALTEAGCEEIFKDRGQSGSKKSRPELDRCLKALKPGDTLIVWKLDRLARSLVHLLDLMNGFRETGIDIKSLTEAFDTTTPHGRLIFSVCGAFAEFERSLIIERTNAGLAVAKANGVKLGAPKVSQDKIDAVSELVVQGYTKRKACLAVGIGEASYYRAMREDIKPDPLLVELKAYLSDQLMNKTRISLKSVSDKFGEDCIPYLDRLIESKKIEIKKGWIYYLPGR